MKKIFLMAYVRKNLGDDLYIKMLTEKYKNYHFYLQVNSGEYVDELSKIPNLHIEICDNLKDKLYNSNIQEYDAYIYIGGSIFIEPKNKPIYFNNFDKFLLNCKNNNIPFYYISCNFGPYYTNSYFEYSKRLFNYCSGICFRDKYSYDLFKNIPTVRYAPDFVLNYKPSSHAIIKDSIGISVVNLDNRHNCDFQEIYLKALVNNINHYLNIGKKIYLFSFCNYEGDEKFIKRIIKNLNKVDGVEFVRYNGNIDNFIQIYSQMEYSICTRFHSFILSSLLMQKSYILSYSSKLNNVTNDLNLGLPISNINNLSEDTVLELTNFKVANKSNLNEAIFHSKKQERVIKL